MKHGSITSRRVHSVGSNVENSIGFALFVGSDFFDSIGHIVECRIFDIRSPLLGMSDFRHSISRPSNIQHSKRPSSDVGFSTFDRPSVECRTFDIRSTLCRIFGIRSAVRRMSNIHTLYNCILILYCHSRNNLLFLVLCTI